MKLLICLISYNRLDYTKRTLANLHATITVPHYIIAVDNASTDGTQDWLENHAGVNQVILNERNLYPGAACNKSWKMGLEEYPEATHLMRLDNDMHFEEGWDTNAVSYFEAIPDLGQLGLDYDAIDNDPGQRNQLSINDKILHPWPGCVGGPCIIPRSVWDYGIRYDETPWHIDPGNFATMQEDAKMSQAISKAGFLFGHVHEQLSWTFAKPDTWHEYPDYYKKTMTERGYPDPFTKEGKQTKKAYGGKV